MGKFSGAIVLPVILSLLANVSETSQETHKNSHDFLALTVATDETDGFKRFLHSAEIYDIPVTVLGKGEQWAGGDMHFAGGGQKVELLKEELAKYKDKHNKVILFTDSYDVIFLATVNKIVKQFEKSGARILFSAEGFCWPDKSLSVKYPNVLQGKRFLNSGGFIGYAPEMYQLVATWKGSAKDDDQLFYTERFLDEDVRAALKMKLDHKGEIFQNLNGAVADIELEFTEDGALINNVAYRTKPLIIHGNGPAKQALNTLGNYLAKSWSPNTGCTTCESNLKELPEEKSKWPSVLVGVFVQQATPFLEEFLNKIVALDYPKSSLHIFIHNRAEYHGKQLEEFVSKYKSEYQSVEFVPHIEEVAEEAGRNKAISHCVDINCDYLFVVDSIAHLDNKDTLKNLIQQNKPVIAPLLTRPGKAWSNFWGALNSDGYYARSADYLQIVEGERKGVWNVPFISACYLAKGAILAKEDLRPTYTSSRGVDPDMAFCESLRHNDIFMFVDNLIDFGHLINADSFDTSHVHNELYQIFDNKFDFEQRYIHENYTRNFNPNHTALQPCPDVYWFPVVTERYCDELIAEMENFGQWSDGKNSDPRLDGGYENVPTRDIHMKQVGMEQHWLEFLRVFVRPLQEHVFLGYTHDPPRAIMNFVVRYRPDEQPFLRPHHDSSTYTINLALNTPKVDYEGGGCRFIRYNCSVLDTRKGWLLMHPGRLTHYHEGLYVTRGTRYIMVSFVDP
ncbi:multifunctional procollagen lysine hydroxylase and glycosyltransferase LH3 [Neocloeon triangulifer]|uniref:multifunctional procollagen lysine hydroxylase and glycosyltransferase LH3 n=1 Tax=Neocloeon triangulifer TaxID=2078957 RepID=UPI00286EBAE9|nr:multifunctional procollagen lysine hydroxylase and glycosyltransferase LH3 [Neocloeon triangulifer]